MKHIEYKPFFAALLALTVIGMAASLATLGVRADDNEAITFRTQLTGFGEVPPKLADGSGTFSGKLSADGQSLSWTLTWTGLTGPALVAHIHFGQPQNTGMPVVFFCGSGTLTGTFTAADVVAVPTQNVTAGDFAGFVKILRAHLGYANIHTTQFMGGEIRGQIRVGRGDEN